MNKLILASRLAQLAGAGVMIAGIASCGSGETSGSGPMLFLGGFGVIIFARIVAWLSKE